MNVEQKKIDLDVSIVFIIIHPNSLLSLLFKRNGRLINKKNGIDSIIINPHNKLKLISVSKPY